MDNTDRSRLLEVLGHRSVTASASALVTLAACSLVADLPLWLWATWAALSVAALAQAFRR